MPRKKSADNQRIELRSSELIANVAELAELAKEALSSKGDVVVAAGDVERLHTPAVQVLLSLGQSLEKGKRKLVLESPSEAVEQTFNALGLGEVLTQWASSK